MIIIIIINHHDAVLKLTLILIHICIVTSGDGYWSSWSEWSECDEECKRYRRRRCESTSSSSSNGSGGCSGKDVQMSNCTGGFCIPGEKISLDDFFFPFFFAGAPTIFCTIEVLPMHEFIRFDFTWLVFMGLLKNLQKYGEKLESPLSFLS